jgi:hypothetical protein
MAFDETIAIPDEINTGNVANSVPATDLVTGVTCAEAFRCGIKISQDTVVKVNGWREIRGLREWFAFAFFAGVSEETF